MPQSDTHVLDLGGDEMTIRDTGTRSPTIMPQSDTHVLDLGGDEMTVRDAGTRSPTVRVVYASARYPRS